ncbi:MAG: FtsH protease activity modulator HflK [Synergistaceae bacterium]|uniref:FtsH protease activity modulator HflK n=1 Tax=Aminivibrio sp. TaxID=1872489 RepID=UPI001D2F771F|nr:FtsH protease activity modulator HflK [Synergistaceae bacterium]NCC57114.1 FtsH protease activity modulator HflK [Synergistales bacterium]MDD3390843.1 FtsH protease activity modulator HflK [Synergistaceae bacterium]MDD3689650.1 FtsH protease activity modulator HflK [Synergistaceae bacterium]MDD4022158.1 FtsH protease activity modulator HflK [Synergistaceae bacterium]
MRNLFEEILDMFSRGKRQEQQFDGEEWGVPRQKEKRPLRLGFLKYILVMLVIALIAYQGFYIVPAGSRGVIFRLGKVSSVADQGINFKIPVIDRVTIVNTEQIQRFEYGYRTVNPGPPARFTDRPEESKMLTGDNKIVEIDWVLQFQAGDPVPFVVNLPEDRYSMEKMIRDVAESTLREVIASRALDDVLTTEKEASQTEAKKLIQEKMELLKTGIFIVAVQFQDVNPPEAVQAAFSDINTARAERERMILEADKYANEVLSKAEGEADKILNEAEAYKFRRISLAEGEAARIRSLHEAFRENPDLVMNNLWLENMEKVWPKLKVFIVDGGENSLQILPLEQFFKSAGAQTPEANK